MGPTVKFLVLATPRTGSTLVVYSLTPNCANEIWDRGTAELNGGFDFTRQNPDKYFLSMCPNPTHGAKILATQLEQMKSYNDSYNKLFNCVEKVICVGRRNLTEQAISLKVAEKFGFHFYTTDKGPNIKKVTLDIDYLKTLAENWVEQHRKWKSIAEQNCEVVTVWYEDLEADTLNKTNELRKFVGMPVNDSVTKRGLIKLASDERYKNIVANYNEIIQEMGNKYGVPFVKLGTRWEE